MSDVQPFATTTPADHVCLACQVYRAEVVVLDPSTQPPDTDWTLLALCRVCLRRMRVTLKDAEKALPRLPKRVRPD